MKWGGGRMWSFYFDSTLSIRPKKLPVFGSKAIAPVSALESRRRALAPGLGDLQIQPGLAPRPARQQPRSAWPRLA
jgi:hypothetical protein